jgi:hypothetical protein
VWCLLEKKGEIDPEQSVASKVKNVFFNYAIKMASNSGKTSEVLETSEVC